MNCLYCGDQFEPKKMPWELTGKEAENAIEEMCRVGHELTFGDACEKQECQDYAQHEADQFDMARKGEF